MIELPIEVFILLVAHLPILLSAVLPFLALIIYASYMVLKRIVLWLSAFVEVCLYFNQVPWNRRVETWHDRDAILAAQARLRPWDEMENEMENDMEREILQRERILGLLQERQRG